MTKRFQLPKDFAEKWVAALRSGQYKQTTGFLYYPTQSPLHSDGYCCLGVAGCITGYSIGKMAFQELVFENENLDDIYPKELSVPGTSHSNCLVTTLTEMNDRGTPFSQISDWIEANVEFV